MKIRVNMISYGEGAQALALSLGIPESEGKQYLKDFADLYPNVALWQQELIKKVKTAKVVTSILGRKRRFHNPRPGDSIICQGKNAPVQSSAADQVKVAAIQVQDLLRELGAHILLIVHDEIIYDVPENVGISNLRRIADIMCNAIPLKTGMKSDIEVGRKWGDKITYD